MSKRTNIEEIVAMQIFPKKYDNTITIIRLFHNFEGNRIPKTWDWKRTEIWLYLVLVLNLELLKYSEPEPKSEP